MLNARSSINQRVGPTLLLRVMAGDTLTASTYTWYSGAPVTPGTEPSLLNSLGTLLASDVLGISGTKYVQAEAGALTTAAGPALTSFLNAKDAAYSSSAPKAFLNWALLDDRFNYVSGGVTQVPVITGTMSKQVITANLPSVISKTGYLYIYVSNESPQDVYFDNVTIQHHRGPLLAEEHYYPFGLSMCALSSKSANSMINRNKFNAGTEFTEDLGINTYETEFRSYNPQIGRFLQIDALADAGKEISPYVFADDNPITLNDPWGLSKDSSGTKPLPGMPGAAPAVLKEVVVKSVVHKKLPTPDVEIDVKMPYAQLVEVALDRNKESFEKILELDNLNHQWIPAERRAFDGKMFKNIVSGWALEALDKAFTVVEMYDLAKTFGEGSETPLEIPLIGGVSQMIVDDMVESSDRISLETALKQGYVPLARIMSSSIGRRSGLVGVYVTKDVMKAILLNGGLNLRINKAYDGGGPVDGPKYPDNPTTPDGEKLSYFIFFPAKSEDIITNFGVMPIK